MRFVWLLSAMVALQATPPSTNQEPVRVGSRVSPPQKIKDVKPLYPAEAQQAHVEGAVLIEVTIDAYGKVRNAVILRSIPFLDQPALNAVRLRTSECEALADASKCRHRLLALPGRPAQGR